MTRVGPGRPSNAAPVAGDRPGWRSCSESPLSLCANIAAPELNVFAVAAAACPPLALLLSVELLNHALEQLRAETTRETSDEIIETERPPRLVVVTGGSRQDETATAERGCGRTTTPSGPRVVHRPVRSWIALSEPTTTGGACCVSGESLGRITRAELSPHWGNQS